MNARVRVTLTCIRIINISIKSFLRCHFVFIGFRLPGPGLGNYAAIMYIVVLLGVSGTEDPLGFFQLL